MKQAGIESQVAGFLWKTFSMLNDPDNRGIIQWDRTGRILQILNIEAFQAVVLPNRFRHRQIKSFVRQLNMYGFKKIKKSAQAICFSHPLFTKDGEADLVKIQRRKRLLKTDGDKGAQKSSENHQATEEEQTSGPVKIENPKQVDRKEERLQEEVVILDQSPPNTQKNPQNFLTPTNGNPYVTQFFVPTYPTVPYYYERPEMFRPTIYQNPLYDYCRVVYL